MDGNRASFRNGESRVSVVDRDDPRFRLAAERTFLAWIRTGIALMGFGFVVARFSFLMKEMGLAVTQGVARSTGVSVWMGVLLVILGVLVNGFAAKRYHEILRAFDKGQSYRFPKRPLETGVALALVVLGLAMAVRLISLGE